MNIKIFFQRIAILIYIVLSVLYLTWRIGFTLNMDQLVASMLLLFADVVMCVSAILFVVSLWRKPVCNKSVGSKTEPFSVDVFVPTYNEDCAMLETTLQHCIEMDCPHTTWLLDDDDRPEMKALADRLGVGYIARTENTGAKAGNQNNAL